MRGEQDDGLPAIDRAPDELGIGELDACLELLGAGAEAPEGLDDRVRQVL
jgi:hypothetical protein